jgi:hypothetical protein
MKVYLLNAFSLNMIPADAQGGKVVWSRIGVKAGADMSAGAEGILDYGRDFVSAVGHADTAAVFASVLGFTVPTNRVNVTLQPGDIAVVGQYVGPRLPEGAKELPVGARIDWFRLEFQAATNPNPPSAVKPLPEAVDVSRMPSRSSHFMQD